MQTTKYRLVEDLVKSKQHGCHKSDVYHDRASNDYFPIMKYLSQHTQISSAGRAQELETFMNDLQTNLEAQKEMSQWNLNFNRRFLKMMGRTYTPE